MFWVVVLVVGSMAGATGAGKTHTMMGSERTGESVEQDHHTLSGIIPQVRGRLRWSMHEAKDITPCRLHSMPFSDVVMSSCCQAYLIC